MRSGLPKTRVFGVGNPFRRDDGVGFAVIERLRTTRSLEIVAETSSLADLIEPMRECEKMILIDAATGLKEGQIMYLDALREALPQFSNLSSHTLCLTQVIGIARALGILPQELVVYAIGGMDFSFGEGLSPKVERAAAEVAGRIVAECTQGLCT